MDLITNVYFTLAAVLPYTVSPLELAWFIPMMFGLLRFGNRWIRTDRGRNQLRKAKINGPVDLISTNRWILNGGFSIAFEFWAGAGVIAMVTPPSRAQDPESEYFALALTSTVFLFAAALLLILIGEVIDRNTGLLYRNYSRPRDPRDRRVPPGLPTQ